MRSETLTISAPLIAIFPNDLEIAVCDDDTDEIAILDLTVNHTLLTGGNPELTVDYYGSLSDLSNGFSIADPTSYMNIVNPQTI